VLAIIGALIAFFQALVSVLCLVFVVTFPASERIPVSIFTFTVVVLKFSAGLLPRTCISLYTALSVQLLFVVFQFFSRLSLCFDGFCRRVCTTRATVYGSSVDRYAPQNAGRRT